VLDLRSGVEHYVLDSLPPQPWRNGGGVTRLVAAEAHGTWRVSCAEVAHDGAYSAFPGMDRVQILLEGGPVSLHAAGWHARLRHTLDDAHFPGEAAVHARLSSSPARMWNVMVSRGRASSQVQRLPVGPVSLRPRSDELLRVLYVVAGAPRLGERPLAARGGLICPAGCGTETDPVLIVARDDVVLLTQISECKQP
jgi:environmental stress-induced protein Ves